MVKKLYVGGLSYQTTEDSLREAFAQAGTIVSVVVIKDKFSGQSKGFGFVEVESEEVMNAAISMWDGKEFEGRTLRVNEARPMEDRPPRRDNYSRGPQRSGGYGGGNNRGGGSYGGGDNY
ncbi:RNA-binding protein [Candidatus Shapirobacteria bacterium]|nr:RNA-binding protein [Candidatus Shapirobacteria bacterium]